MDDILTEILVEDMIRKELWLAVYKMAFEESINSKHAAMYADSSVAAYDRKFNDKGDGLV